MNGLKHPRLPRSLSTLAPTNIRKRPSLVKSTQKEFTPDSVSKAIKDLNYPYTIDLDNKDQILKELDKEYDRLRSMGYPYGPDEAEKVYERAMSFQAARKRVDDIFERDYGDLTKGEDGLEPDEVEDLKIFTPRDFAFPPWSVSPKPLSGIRTGRILEARIFIRPWIKPPRSSAIRLTLWRLCRPEGPRIAKNVNCSRKRNLRQKDLSVSKSGL